MTYADLDSSAASLDNLLYRSVRGANASTCSFHLPEDASQNLTEVSVLLVIFIILQDPLFYV